MDIKLNKDERIDDLGLKGLKIIQNSKWFCFGIDSVLLSDFSKNIKKDARVIDLGTGTGIISILLCGKTELKNIVGVDIQENVCEMANRSILLNELQNRAEIVCDNITNMRNRYDTCSFDVVVTNPPYKKNNTGIKNGEKQKEISRHEIYADLDDFLKTAFYLLKDKGEFYMVHRPERLVDVMNCMRKNKIEPKTIRFVFSNVNKAPVLFLIKGIKNAKSFLEIMPNLYIYDNDGLYTEEIKKIYGNV